MTIAKDNLPAFRITNRTLTALLVFFLAAVFTIVAMSSVAGASDIDETRAELYENIESGEVINLTPLPEIVDDSDDPVSEPTNGAPEIQHNNIRAAEGVASPFQNLQYTLMFWEGQWVVTLRGIIDADLILPATVEIGVPTGTAVSWIGEVDPGFEGESISPSEISAPWNIYTEGDTDIYTIVLNRSHAVQLEFAFDGNPIVESSEDGAVQFSYTPLTDVGELWLATAIPANSAVTDTHLQELEGVGPNGELSFARVIVDAQGGQEYTALIEYRTGVTSVENNLPVWVIVVLISVLVLIAAVVFLLFNRGKLKEA